MVFIFGLGEGVGFFIFDGRCYEEALVLDVVVVVGEAEGGVAVVGLRGGFFFFCVADQFFVFFPDAVV